MKKKQPVKTKYDTHIYLDAELWRRVESLAVETDRSVTATLRVLIKEALSQRVAK